MQPVRLAPPVVEELDYNMVAKGHASVAAMLVVTSGFALGAFPLFCRTCPLDQSQVPLHDWLAPRPHRQQELHDTVRSSSFRWFLWNSFASAAAHVHELTGGLSPVCRCKVPERASQGSMGYWGPLWEVQEDSLPRLNTFLENLWWGLRGCYLVLPGEKVMKYLMHHQKEMMEYRQREGIASSSSRFSQNPPPGPGCFWYINRVAGHVLVSEGLDPEQVMAEHAVTLPQLQLVINMLLLLWPKGTAAAPAVAAAGGAAAAPGAATQTAAAGTGRAADAETGADNVQGAEEGSTGCKGGNGGAAAAGEANGTASAAAASAAGPKTDMPHQAAAGALGDGQGAAAPPDAGAVDAAATGGTAAPPAAAAAAAGSSKIAPSAEGLPQFASKESCTGTLLLLAAMLQQAPVGAKQQLMREEEGNLLLQLLYRVLQDQRDYMAERPVKVQTFLEGVLETVINRGMPNFLEAAFGGVFSHATPVSVLDLVLMVLQSLLFVGDPWEVDALIGREQLMGMDMWDGE